MGVVKLNGIAVAGIVKVNGIASGSLKKWNGIDWVSVIEEVFSPEQGIDDGHCKADESGYSNSTDAVILGNAGGANGHYAFFRFDGLDVIPKYAICSSAVITFTAHATNSETTINLLFQVYYNDDDPPPDADEIVNEVFLSSEEVQWHGLESWVDGQTYDSPDISALIQTGLDHDAWPYDYGGGIVIHLWDDDFENPSSDGAQRQVSSYDYDGGSEKPVLNVTWYLQYTWWADDMSVLTTWNHYGSGDVTQETFDGEETFKFDSYPSSYINSFMKRDGEIFGGDYVVAEVRFYVDTFDNAPWDDISFRVITARDVNLNIRIGGDNHEITHYDGDDFIEIGETISLDTWHKLAYVINQSNGWENATADIYLDDVKVGNNVDVSYEASQKSAGYASIHTDGGVVMYVDFMEVRATL